MKNARKIVAWGAVAVIGVSGLVYAATDAPGRQPTVFYAGHTHDADGTHGAPAHSGGTDKNGCHNGSVPYHCH